VLRSPRNATGGEPFRWGLPEYSRKYSLGFPIVNAIIDHDNGQPDPTSPYLIEDRKEQALTV
jgi:hypothetical protein